MVEFVNDTYTTVDESWWLFTTSLSTVTFDLLRICCTTCLYSWQDFDWAFVIAWSVWLAGDEVGSDESTVAGTMPCSHPPRRRLLKLFLPVTVLSVMTTVVPSVTPALSHGVKPGGYGPSSTQARAPVGAEQCGCMIGPAGPPGVPGVPGWLFRPSETTLKLNEFFHTYIVKMHVR